MLRWRIHRPENSCGIHWAANAWRDVVFPDIRYLDIFPMFGASGSLLGGGSTTGIWPTCTTAEPLAARTGQGEADETVHLDMTPFLITLGGRVKAWDDITSTSGFPWSPSAIGSSYH